MRFIKDQSGRTMVEMIAILGFLAAFSAGIIHVVSTMYDKYRVSRVSQQIEDLRKGISNRYLADGNYTGLTVAGLIKDGIVPADMVAGASDLKHSFLGDVKVKGYSNRYTVTFDHVPLEGCIELAMINWTTGDTSDLINLRINTHTYRWPAAPGASSYLLPVALTDAAKDCKDGDNRLIWNFQ